MQKKPKTVARKPTQSPPQDEQASAEALAAMALELAELEFEDADADPDDTPLALRAEFEKLLRNALRKCDDALLYGALECAREADLDGYRFLRAYLEEHSASIMLRREGAPTMEMTAFAIPLFVHSIGGLRSAELFSDQQAFDDLLASIGAADLESAQAKVVLINHAYDLAEFERISFGELQGILREAAAAMNSRKLVPMPALERSMPGWAPGNFGPGDQAVELRFLLGFALKRADDPFYQVPAEEAAADAYFAQRMARYQGWTEQAAPLLRRCLALDPDALSINFLYQDLFFGAREQGMAELDMLRMMASVHAALETHGVAPQQARATVGPLEIDGQMLLHLRLEGPDGALLATSDKPLDLAAELRSELADMCDALATLDLASVSVAKRFGPDGQAREAQPYQG